MSDPRLQAALILQEILEQKVFAAEAKSHLDSQAANDLPFINMLVQTSLRHLVYIKQVLKNFIKKKLPKDSAFGYYALILGATEVLYLRTPDYAVINSYVDITKKHPNKFVGGFVNAVLRKVCADKEKFIQEDAGLFFPNDFRGLINNDYGRKTASLIEKAAIKEPALDISVKTGVKLPNATILPLGTNRLKNDGSPVKIAGYNEGLWWVQDFSSALPVKLLGDIKGKRVLDLCAAPGGKTAQLINAGARVTAVDVSPARLKRLSENLQRLNMSTEKTICADGLEYLRNFSDEPFDIILLDAPCSATGTLRRHPEIVHIKSAADIAKSADLQKQFLTLADNALKPNGTLLYCTCSLAKTEGEKQISEFVKTSPYVLDKPVLPTELKELQSVEGWVRILPSNLQTFGGADGFFIAILHKE